MTPTPPESRERVLLLLTAAAAGRREPFCVVVTGAATPDGACAASLDPSSAAGYESSAPIECKGRWHPSACACAISSGSIEPRFPRCWHLQGETRCTHNAGEVAQRPERQRGRYWLAGCTERAKVRSYTPRWKLKLTLISEKTTEQPVVLACAR